MVTLHILMLVCNCESMDLYVSTPVHVLGYVLVCACVYMQSVQVSVVLEIIMHPSVCR